MRRSPPVKEEDVKEQGEVPRLRAKSYMDKGDLVPDDVICGVIVERLAFRPLRVRGADPLLSLVSSLGVAVALVNITQYLFGAEPYSYPDPLEHLPSAVNFGTASQPVLVRTVQVVIFGVSMVMLVLAANPGAEGPGPIIAVMTAS